MAINRNAPVQALGVDGAVVAMSQDRVYGQVASARNGSKAERRESKRQAARNRFQVDISPELEALVREMAEQESVPMSQVMQYLMIGGLMAIEQGIVTGLAWSKTPSRSMRFEYTLTMPQLPDKGGAKGRR